MQDPYTEAIRLIVALTPLHMFAVVAFLLAFRKQSVERKTRLLIFLAGLCIPVATIIFVTTVVLIMSDSRIMNSGYEMHIRMGGLMLWTGTLSLGSLILTRTAIQGRAPVHLDADDEE